MFEQLGEIIEKQTIDHQRAKLEYMQKKEQFEKACKENPYHVHIGFVDDTQATLFFKDYFALCEFKNDYPSQYSNGLINLRAVKAFGRPECEEFYIKSEFVCKIVFPVDEGDAW